MATGTEFTQSAQPKRPGRTAGVTSEFTLFPKIKPGHVDALREALDRFNERFSTSGQAALEQIGRINA